MEQNEVILCVSFNQDNSLFALGTNKGFKIFMAYPIEEKAGRGIKLFIYLIKRLCWWNRSYRNA